MTPTTECPEPCPDLIHTENIAKYNSKYGKTLYKLDPWYRKLISAHMESRCKICNPDWDKPQYYCRKCDITFPTKAQFDNHTTCTSKWCS